MGAEGRTVIFISHKLEEVMAVSSRLTVLRRGRVVGSVLTTGTNPRDLARMMVGRDVVVTQKKEGPAQVEREVILQLRGVSALGDLGTVALRDIDLSVHAGEIVGVAGVAGNGQRELAEVISGMRRLTTGAVVVAGKSLRPGDPLAAIRRGVSHVPEDRMGTGVAPSLSIADNLVLKAYRRAPNSPPGFFPPRRNPTNASGFICRFNITAPGAQTPTPRPSRGNA